MNKFIIILLAVGFIFGQVARFQMGNIAFTLLDLGVALSFILWISNKGLKKKSLLNVTFPGKIFVAFILVGLFSLILFAHNLSTAQLVTSILYPLRLIVYLSLYFQAKELVKKDRNLVLVTMFIAGALVTALGFVQLAFYPALRNLYYLGWDEHLYRMFSVFLDPNFAGAFFVLFTLFGLDQTTKCKTVLQKVIVSLTVIASFLAVFLTYSRTGFIMLIVGLTSYLLFLLPKKITLLVLVLCFVALIMVSNTKIEGLNPFRTASTGARLSSAAHAFAIIERYPLFGVGFNAFRYAQIEMGYREEYPTPQNHADAGTDNSYLFVLATTGIVGGLFFIIFIVSTLKSLKQQVGKENFLSRSMLAGFVGVLVGTLFLNILFYPMIVGWLAIHAGLIRDK